MPKRLGLIVLGAAAIWGASRLRWITATISDDKAGSLTHDVIGSTLSTETSAVALVVLVSAVAIAAFRRLGRRIASLIATAVCLMGMVGPAEVLAGRVDKAQVQRTLSAPANPHEAGAAINQWAQIADIQTAYLGPILCLIGCLLALVGAVWVLVKPGKDKATSDAYSRRFERRENLGDDLGKAPDSGRVMWDALDQDVDPTDTR